MKTKVCRSQYHKNRKLVVKYGITLADKESMINKLNGICPICHERFETKADSLGRSGVIDHDHITGNIRGVLCSNCNTSLGLLQDSPLIAIELAKYIIDNCARGVDYKNTNTFKNPIIKAINELEELLCQ